MAIHILNKFISNQRIQSYFVCSVNDNDNDDNNNNNNNNNLHCTLIAH